VSLPGPSGFSWGLDLLFFALLFLPVGECLRRLAARWSPLARSPEIVELLLVDLFLGGGAFYVFAALPTGLFGLAAFWIIVGAAVLFLSALALRHRSSIVRLLSRTRLGSATIPLVVLALFLFLLAVELLVAQGVPTGNTFDSSLLTTYTALLLQHGTIPVSLAPVATQGVPYPQGTTVWLGAAQLLFALPPARLALLVTPLFLALPPVAGYVLGRRLLQRARAGLAFALVFGLISSWTRVLVAGSNDFVFAFPLVLLLIAWAPVWTQRTPPTWGDALFFGALAGYSAAMNPVGAELLFPVLLLSALLAHPRLGGAVIRWLLRWVAALGSALLFVLPTLVVLYLGRASPSWTSGAVLVPTHGAPGLSIAQFVGLTDPFLFGATSVWLSPIPLLRAELAILIVFGAAFLLGLVPGLRPEAAEGTLARFLLVSILASIAGVAGYVLLRDGVSFLVFEAYLSSASELSILLFTLLAVLVAVPVARFLEEAALFLPKRSGPEPSLSSAPPSTSRATSRRRWPAAAFAIVIVLVASGATASAVQLPPVLSEQYAPFGNVTTGDFALLVWAETHLSPGARVLVAPGSAGQFLPGYVPQVRLLFPMGPVAGNATYQSLLPLLENGTLGGGGNRSLALLQVEYIVVTGANNRLFLPFLATPFLSDPSGFPLLFHDADAYVFARA
jgi:hypothetical protein